VRKARGVFDVDTSYAEAEKALARIASYSPESDEEWAARLGADLAAFGDEGTAAIKSLDLDDDAARYTALEDPNIIIRTWR
jgi:hypothetical protein